MNDILPKLANAKYFAFIEESSRYHNLARSTLFIFDYVSMPVWLMQVEETTILISSSRQHFQRKIDLIFKKIPNVFGITDDSLHVAHDSNGKDHDNML